VFLAYIDARPERPNGPPPWEPNWRMWRWFVAGAMVGFGAGHADGGIQYALILVVIAVVCLGINEALPSMRGLRDWHQ
jgi:hypothetical protein